MTFLELLEQSSPADALQHMTHRFAANHHFFKEHLPDLGALLDQPTERYELSISPSGINLRNKSTKQEVYPVENGRSLMFDLAKTQANKPMINPLWKRHTNRNGLIRQQEEGFPVTARGVNTLIDLFMADPDFDHKQLDFAGDRHLPTLTLLGLLSGACLEALMENYERFHGILIYEPDPDFFILSCYFADYARVYQKTNEDSCFLIVRGVLDHTVAKRFFSNRLITNCFLRLELTQYDHPHLVDGQHWITP